MFTPASWTFETAIPKVKAFIAVAFFGAIIAGLAFVSVKVILNQHDSLNFYRDIGYMPDDRTINWAAGRLAAGLIGVALSLWMAIRLFNAWKLWRTTGGSPWSLLVEQYYPFFALAGILLLVLISVGSYYGVITQMIPDYIDYIAGGGLNGRDESDGLIQARNIGYFTGGVIFPLIIGTGALVGALYLALRLVANAVKFFLRQDGVIK